MSDLAADVLRILRVFGPCSNAEVARRLGVGRERTYRMIQALANDSLASHPKLQRWAITPRGRRVFDDLPNKTLALFQENQAP